MKGWKKIVSIILFFSLFTFLFSLFTYGQATLDTSLRNLKHTMTPNFAIAIHGGAGTILKQNMTAAKDSAYRKTLNEAMQAGYDILKKGGTSLDAVEAAVKVMEDSPLFNA